MGHGGFVTAINCMDGRVQQPVFDYMSREYGMPYVDMITEPGPIKILEEQDSAELVESIRARLDVSVRGHGSSVIAVVGHYDCTGNPVDRETQFRQTAASIELIKTWGFDAELIGLWVNEEWNAERVI
ncbi:MAG TPA: hypothetical protein PLN69_06420 [bacterium]|nr:hypothetical protein [bacterium]